MKCWISAMRSLIGELGNPAHPAYDLFERVKDEVAGTSNPGDRSRAPACTREERP